MEHSTKFNRALQLAGRIDTVVFDIQDIGTRFYTYMSTLGNMMEECAKAGKRVVVLDRPNPLGGKTASGWPKSLGNRPPKKHPGCREQEQAG